MAKSPNEGAAKFAGTIRLANIGRDKFEAEIIEILTERSAPAFELPAFAVWEKGERGLTARAMILMKAGLDALKKQYPLVETIPLSIPAQENKIQQVKNSESVDGWN